MVFGGLDGGISVSRTMLLARLKSIRLLPLRRSTRLQAAKLLDTREAHLRQEICTYQPARPEPADGGLCFVRKSSMINTWSRLGQLTNTSQLSRAFRPDGGTQQMHEAHKGCAHLESTGTCDRRSASRVRRTISASARVQREPSARPFGPAPLTCLSQVRKPRRTGARRVCWNLV